MEAEYNIVPEIPEADKKKKKKLEKKMSTSSSENITMNEN